MKTFFKKLFCKHVFDKFVSNIYGDGINLTNGKRSIWECSKCGKLKFSEKLHEEK